MNVVQGYFILKTYCIQLYNYFILDQRNYGKALIFGLTPSFCCVGFWGKTDVMLVYMTSGSIDSQSSFELCTSCSTISILCVNWHSHGCRMQIIWHYEDEYYQFPVFTPGSTTFPCLLSQIQAQLLLEYCSLLSSKTNILRC